MYNQIQKKFTFNYNKAVATLLYVAQDVDNLYNILKVLYFADREHLSKYGRFIFGDSYIAMDFGQVPTKIYDMIKFVRGDGTNKFDDSLKELISVENKKFIKAKAKPDLDYLSQSDIECLRDSIRKHGKIHFWTLLNKSHADEAYNKTPLNQEIELDAIIDTLDNKYRVKSYLQNLYE